MNKYNITLTNTEIAQIIDALQQLPDHRRDRVPGGETSVLQRFEDIAEVCDWTVSAFDSVSFRARARALTDLDVTDLGAI